MKRELIKATVGFKMEKGKVYFFSEYLPHNSNTRISAKIITDKYTACPTVEIYNFDLLSEDTIQSILGDLERYAREALKHNNDEA